MNKTAFKIEMANELAKIESELEELGGLKVLEPLGEPNLPDGKRQMAGSKGAKGKKDWTRTRAALGRLTFYSRKLIAFALVIAIWLFVAEFLLQFFHTHSDGASLADLVHRTASIVQAPLERVVGFDARYELPQMIIDFMPLILFVILMIAKNRIDALLIRIEKALKNESNEPQSPLRMQVFDPSAVPSNATYNYVGRSAQGDNRAALMKKILAIHSE